MGQIVSLTLHRFEGRAARAWAFAMMGLARRPLARVPGIGFWKLCGTGTGEGFAPRPNWSVYAILATWPDLATARAALDAPIFARFRRRADEQWTILLSPISARGAWSGRAPFAPEVRGVPVPGSAPDAGTRAEAAAGPLAVLTRGTIRPRALPRFWGRVPGISARIGSNDEVLFKIGLGEVPWLHQVTFSVWPDAAAVARFARRGPHAEAIAAVRAEGWFSEDLYARFAVAGEVGAWGGGSPLASQPRTLAEAS